VANRRESRLFIRERSSFPGFLGKPNFPEHPLFTMPAALTPEPPYYAVIFTSQRTAGDQGYGKMAQHMDELAASQPGYLGIESARDAEGFGITVSYWATEEALVRWKQNMEHRGAQREGRETWYRNFTVRISRVERAYGGALPG